MRRRTLGHGTVAASAEWCTVSETDLALPAPTIASPFIVRGALAAPHVHISYVGRREAADADTEAERFQVAFIGRIPRARVLRRSEFEFKDGEIGQQVVFALEPAPGLRAVQQHVFRVTSGVLHHLSVTMSQSASTRLDASSSVLASFVPA